MLGNAYAMAAHAVDIKPESAFAQYARSTILLAKGDVTPAKIVSDKSYRLNPDDGAVAFGHAPIRPGATNFALVSAGFCPRPRWPTVSLPP
jgi:hypothetical protein